jgi:hypothetical protein
MSLKLLCQVEGKNNEYTHPSVLGRTFTLQEVRERWRQLHEEHINLYFYLICSEQLNWFRLGEGHLYGWDT